MYFKNTIFFTQIGVLPNNPALTINDLDDVRQIDGLFRAHVLLAELAGRSSPDYKDYLIQAHTYLMRLWQVSTMYFFISLYSCCFLKWEFLWYMFHIQS